QLFHPRLVLTSGDGPGWAAPECLRMDVDCIATEPHLATYCYLQDRLLQQTGTMMYEEGRKVIFWNKVWVYLNKRSKVNNSKDDKRQHSFDVRRQSSIVAGLTDHAAATVVENLAEIPNLDRQEAEAVLKAAKKSIGTIREAQGITPGGN